MNRDSKNLKSENHRILDRRGYILNKQCLTPEQQTKIRKDLNIIPTVLPAFRDIMVPAKPFKIYTETERLFYVPRYYGIDKFGEPAINLISPGLSINLNCVFDLLPHQIKAWQAMTKLYDSGKSGVMSLFCGGGKTSLAIRLACHLKTKTLIVVNTEVLMEQWRDRISQFTGGQARIGIIQRNKIDYKDRDFVVAMLHSLSFKEYEPATFDEFGLTVFDECFPGDQRILTEAGPITIESLYHRWYIINLDGEVYTDLPRVLSFNEMTQKFEYKAITYAWKKQTSDLIKFKVGHNIVRCTPGHLFLTSAGWKEAKNLRIGDSIYAQPYRWTPSTRKEDATNDETNDATNDETNDATRDEAKFEITPYRYMKINTILNQTQLTEQINVYDLEVADNHNFIVCSASGIGIVAHNCHHTAAAAFSQSLPKVASRYLLGLSATPERKDGFSRVFYSHLGPLFYQQKREGNNQVQVRAIQIKCESPAYRVEYYTNGTVKTSTMVTNIADFPIRNVLIVEILGILAYSGRKILLLGARREQLEYLKAAIDQKSYRQADGTPVTTGLYYGANGKTKQLHRALLAESEKAQIILGTTNIAQEGLDIPALNTLFLITSLSDVEQASGRILRKYHEKLNPMIVDLVDMTGNFPKHYSKRKTYYQSEDYQVAKVMVKLDDQLESIKQALPSIAEFLGGVPQEKPELEIEINQELEIDSLRVCPKDKSVCLPTNRLVADQLNFHLKVPREELDPEFENEPQIIPPKILSSEKSLHPMKASTKTVKLPLSLVEPKLKTIASPTVVAPTTIKAVPVASNQPKQKIKVPITLQPGQNQSKPKSTMLMKPKHAAQPPIAKNKFFPKSVDGGAPAECFLNE